jgi:hypothetical protein
VSFYYINYIFFFKAVSGAGPICDIAITWRCVFWPSQPEQPLISGETELPLNEAI